MPESGQNEALLASRMSDACMVCVRIGMARRSGRAAGEYAIARLFLGNQSMDRCRALERFF
ncbi:hypothetical protein BDI4_40090 [Burkholderia diffusa]|nr:hypothetical protein BDI4_40090 [Burkholderia diffusa]